MILQLILVFLISWMVVLRWKSRKLRMLVKKFGCDLSKLPLVGHAYLFMGGGENRMSAIKEISRQAIKHDGWTAIQLGHKFFAVVADPLEADYILKTHLEKDDVLRVSRSLIGNGLIFAPVSIWRPRRKVMAPTFTQHNLNQFVDIFYQQSTIMLDNIKQIANRQTFPIWKYFTSYTMDSVCQTTLGIDIGVQKTADHKFLHNFRTYAAIVSKRFFYPLLQSDTSFKYLCYFGLYSESSKSSQHIKDFVYDVIEKKRESMKAIKENNPTNNNEQKEKPSFKPILELLINASGGEKGYTNEELQEEVSVILVAGTDTSAVGAAFIALMLARYPHIQEKVYKEIHDMYGDTDEPIKAEDLSKLSYLEAVVKEAMRLYPPVPLTARKVVKEDVTPAGIQLTPGMGIAISHWGIHRNPKYWGEDAEEFRPERFFDSPPTHPSAYVPFSSGPRSCLGYKYAMMSMMTVTASLLRRYRILPPDEEDANKPLRVTYEVMMKDLNDFKLRLEPRI